jgi:anti-sigma factor RsiW
MNINRNNYESFFLLYVDNELSAQERNALELFVQENADLREELQMLKQTIVPAEKVIFMGKNSLLKPEAVSAVLEEQLLLYIDKELDAKQSKEVELVLASDKSAATELQLLQQTKIVADTNIIFADKQLLYRKELARVIPFDPIAIGWRRLAVAAVFIGFAIWGTAIYLNSGSKPVVNHTAANTDVKQPDAVKGKQVTIPVTEKTEPAETIVAVTSEPVINKKVTQKTMVAPLVDKQQQAPAVQKNNDVAAQQKIISNNSNNLPKPYFEENKNTTSNKNETTNVIPQTQDINTNIIANSEIDKKARPEEPNNIYTASFTNNSDENKEDRFILSDDEPKKSKLTGLLRKAKRVLERNTNINNGGNTLKVANVEIAIQ